MSYSSRGRDRGRGRGRGRGRARGGGGGRDGRGRGNCIDYKLLGQCERNTTGECPFLHRNREKTVHRTVPIPDRVPMVMARKGYFLKILGEIAEFRLKVTGGTSNSVDIVVSESNVHHLCKIEEQYKIFLSQLYPIGPGWCYIHRDGIAQCETGGLLHFEQYEGRLPPRPGNPPPSQNLLKLCITETSEPDEAASKKVVIKNPTRESETKEGLHKAIEIVHGKGEPFNPKGHRKDVGVKIIKDHEEHMEEMLKGGLEWFDREKRGNGHFVTKLEGRFGKVLWKNVPEDMLKCSWGIQQFADLSFADSRHSRIFNTDVKNKTVRDELKEELISVLETFDIKFTIVGGEERKAVDLRVKFEHGQDGRPTVLGVRKNEAKIVVFDVLCLHRNHDMRMTLNCYEVMNQHSPEYELVKRLAETVSLSDPEEATITLVTNTDEWSVNFIRHKKRGAYRIDDKFIVTVTDIRECQFKRQPLNTLVSVTPEFYCESHTETEFHSCAWECAFGRDVGFSPENALALHLEHPTVEPEIAGAVPHPWKPDDILEDFQEFWDNMDSLNEML